MIAIGMVMLWWSYGLGSWGYVLVRGWNIPARQWFSPLNPYQWPKSGDPPPIPDTEVFPSGAGPVLTGQEAKKAGEVVGKAVLKPPAAVKTG